MLTKENVSSERYTYIFSCNQQSSQSFEYVVTELREKSMKCKLDVLQENLRKTALICDIANNSTREKLLQEDKDDIKTLEEAKKFVKLWRHQNREENIPKSNQYQ